VLTVKLIIWQKTLNTEKSKFHRKKPNLSSPGHNGCHTVKLGYEKTENNSFQSFHVQSQLRTPWYETA